MPSAVLRLLPTWASLLILAFVTVAAGPARAAGDPWQLCSETAAQIEATERLPELMLRAMAEAESARSHPWSHEVAPWPWTLGRAGMNYFYATKADAVAATRAALGKGERALRIGCMQIDLGERPRAFTSLEEAFEPGANIAAAVVALRSLRAQYGSWDQAIENLHARNEAGRTAYRARVFDIWTRAQAQRSRFLDESGIAELPLGRPETRLVLGGPVEMPNLGPRDGRRVWTVRPDPTVAAARLAVAQMRAATLLSLPPAATPESDTVVIAVDLRPRPNEGPSGPGTLALPGLQTKLDLASLAPTRP